MKGIRAAVRYTKSLMQLAQEKNLLDVIIADIRLIQSTINENRELELMLQSPLVKSEKKAAALTSIFGSKINEITLKFLQLVVSQGRENSLGAICSEFMKQYNTIKSIAVVSVTTTTALTDKLRADLVNKIKSDYKLSAVELEEKVDTSLIGGMILRMGDKQLDASIRRQLNDIKQELVQA